MLCLQCRTIFSGEIAQDEYSNFVKETTLHFSLARPATTEFCALCFKIEERLRDDYRFDKILQEPGRKHVDIRFELTFGNTYGDFLTWEIYLGERKFDYRSSLKLFSAALGMSHLLGTEAPVENTTNSVHVFALAQGWLKTCIQDHDTCKIDKSQAKLPTRLLKLDTSDSHQVQLEETSAMQIRPSYMTLSHCWGEEKFLTLTDNTQEELRNGMCVSKLAKTFQDTISIALKLGSQYLWIDSLCIFQDDKEDWSREAPLMAGVYQGSTCNIGASASRSASEGCFRSRDARLVRPLLVSTDFTNPLLPNSEYFLEDRYYYTSIREKDQPLFSRGWVFQERVLSPRTLHFGDRYVFWECETSACSEMYPAGHPCERYDWESVPTQLSKQRSEIERFSTWTRLVETYSSLSLTQPTDKLMAISGIARYLQTVNLSDKYLTGLWHIYFLSGLLWYNNTPGSRDSLVSKAQARSSSYCAPTWSWASLTGRVGHFHSHPTDIKYLCTMESVVIYSVTPDVYGEVLYGRLRVKAQLLECALWNISAWLSLPDVERKSYTMLFTTLGGLYDMTCRIYLYPDHNLDSIERLPNDSAILASSIYLLPITDYYDKVEGILLLPTRESGCYERFGAFELFRGGEYGEPYQDDEFWSGLKARTTARQNLRPKDDPFDITYIVGPREKAKPDATDPDSQQLDHVEEWKAYEEFDRVDYTFSII